MMRYEGWEEGVAAEVKKGPVWKFYGYRKALLLYDLGVFQMGWARLDQFSRAESESRFYGFQVDVAAKLSAKTGPVWCSN